MIRLLRRLRGLALADDGAVTVDWVVLTAIVVGLGVSVAATLTHSQNGSANVASYLSSLKIQ